MRCWRFAIGTFLSLSLPLVSTFNHWFQLSTTLPSRPVNVVPANGQISASHTHARPSHNGALHTYQTAVFSRFALQSKYVPSPTLREREKKRDTAGQVRCSHQRAFNVQPIHRMPLLQYTFSSFTCYLDLKKNRNTTRCCCRGGKPVTAVFRHRWRKKKTHSRQAIHSPIHSPRNAAHIINTYHTVGGLVYCSLRTYNMYMFDGKVVDLSCTEFCCCGPNSVSAAYSHGTIGRPNQAVVPLLVCVVDTLPHMQQF